MPSIDTVTVYYSRRSEQQELWEAYNQWINDTLWHRSMERTTWNSSPTPWAAEQYLSAKPNVSQFYREGDRHCTGTLFLTKIDCLWGGRLYSSSQAVSLATESCLDIYMHSRKICKGKHWFHYKLQDLGILEGWGFWHAINEFCSIQIKFVWRVWLWIVKGEPRCCLVILRI